jgi:hypothetical protein
MKNLTAAFCSFTLLVAVSASAERHTVSLNGEWSIEDSTSAEETPAKFTHRVPVPGLANLAKPGFPNVDAFFSREHLANRVRAKLVPSDWLTNYWKGKVDQDRNYFWYQKTFRAPSEAAVAVLKINKAQFGTAVWLNGKKLGEYSGCFSASVYHLEQAIRWNQDNNLVIRIGAHPAVLPDTYPTGSDFEKIKWTPGIYDDVSIYYCENPLIESVQVVPRLATSDILVQTKITNCGSRPISTSMRYMVKPWKGGKQVSSAASEPLSLEPGESRTLTNTVPMPGARLWSPEDPFLYVLETTTGGDSLSTRFGMREFQFDGNTRRAYLNGRVYFLRGSNITLHRFFEDPLCKNLPWNERWVRDLLGKIPKEMNWNYFRFCIGPVPDRWLDICDEVGLLVQNEFFVWTGGPGWYPGYSRSHDAEEMIRQYSDWMRDNWNHPSVAVWDANNETKDDIFGAKIIPAVKPLDLSNRPWENSYNAPVGTNAPVEDHPYLMSSGGFGKLNFQMKNLETMDGKPRAGALPSDHHAPLINEYGWLWLNRDGTPTRLTENLYPQLLGKDTATSRERLDLYAYLLAGKTEFWRAHRHYAGIIHFVYLTCSYPGVYTADHFADVVRLKLDPAFADYMKEAFRPLGTYINFFQPTLAPGTHDFTVMMVNDHPFTVAGRVKLALENPAGRILASEEKAFAVNSNGDCVLTIPLRVPPTPGKCTLKATAIPEPGLKVGPTVSRRWTSIQKD